MLLSDAIQPFDTSDLIAFVMERVLIGEYLSRAHIYHP
jgi:hypothetical protein